MMLASASFLALVAFEKIILAPAPSSAAIIKFFRRIIGAPAG
jgi:hypothetical protein